MKILHVIREVTKGGGTLGLLQQCVQTQEHARHRVLSLRNPSDMTAVEPFAESNIPVFAGNERKKLVEWADIVQIEWWNNPEVNNFLVNEDLPPCRLLLHSRAHFDAPAMCPSANLLGRVNHCTVTIPSAAENPVFDRNRTEAGLSPAVCVYSSVADFSPDFKPKPPNAACVFGYLGTVEPIKIYPRFLQMIAGILEEIPDAYFLFAGEGTLETYRKTAEFLGIASRIEFLDFVSDIANFLQGLDVFFYPVNKYSYATSEKSLQEAMLAGLPCVLFPHGGIRDIAAPEFSFIGSDEDSFVAGCVQLAKSHSLRAQMGKQAREAIEQFAPRLNWRSNLLSAWETLLDAPRESRSDLNISANSLFEYSTDLFNLCDKKLTGQELEDCRLVAEFVEEGYRNWLER